MSTKSINPAPLTITDAARHLGVTREHLSRVLHGHRESRSLRARFTALVSIPTNPKPTRRQP
jgi:hypothetical protein